MKRHSIRLAIISTSAMLVRASVAWGLEPVLARLPDELELEPELVLLLAICTFIVWVMV